MQQFVCIQLIPNVRVFFFEQVFKFCVILSETINIGLGKKKTATSWNWKNPINFSCHKNLAG